MKAELQIDNRKSQIEIRSFSLVWNHAQNFGQIAIADEAAVTQLPFLFGVFRRQDVPQFRVSPLHFSCSRLLKALGGAFVRF
jgi:hypothetical protein